MKIIVKVIAIGTLAILGACQSPTASLPNPTQQEAAKAIGQIMHAEGKWASWEVADRYPTNCMAGKLGDAEVRSCKVCASVVDIERPWTGSQAVISREIFDIAFKRALSFDQPDVAPADPKMGVWVAVVPPQGPGSQPTSRQVLEQRDLPPLVVAKYTGYSIDGRYIGTGAPIWSKNGYRVDDDTAAYSALLKTNVLSGIEANSLQPCPQA